MDEKSDIERFKEWLDSVKLEYSENEYSDVIYIHIEGGYTGFYSSFAFDINGNFVEHGAYE